MTRLSQWAERVTREMLRAQYRENGWKDTDIGWREEQAARAVLERAMRGFCREEFGSEFNVDKLLDAPPGPSMSADDGD